MFKVGQKIRHSNKGIGIIIGIFYAEHQRHFPDSDGYDYDIDFNGIIFRGCLSEYMSPMTTPLGNEL